MLYGLTVLSVAVSTLVFGATKLRSDGLLSEWKPYFGSGFGFLITLLMMAVLVINRRWKGLIIALAAFGLMLGRQLLDRRRGLIARDKNQAAVLSKPATAVKVGS